MRKQIFNLGEKAAAYYSDATVHNGVAYISGQMSLDLATDQPVHGDIGQQTRLALTNLMNVVKGLGAAAEDVLFVNIYLVEEADFDGFNRVYNEFFSVNPPARVTVTVKDLYGGLKIEMTAIVAVA